MDQRRNDLPASAFKRTRLAPTPSGYLHLGNILNFVLTVGLARKYGASILLRIDDMDQDRVRDAYLQDIFETLDFLELPWDEGPRDAHEFRKSFSQEGRHGLYSDALQLLKDKQTVFACSCSRLQLSAISRDGIYPGTCLDKLIGLEEHDVQWRLKSTPDRIGIRDLISGISMVEFPAQMQYVQVRRKDGKASYQLTSVIDDVFFDVDLIIRGEDLYPSTLAQLHLSALIQSEQFTSTSFFHHPLLSDAGVKLSKSAGGTSIKYLREQGLKRPALYQLLARYLGLQDEVGNWETLFNCLQMMYGLDQAGAHNK